MGKPGNKDKRKSKPKIPNFSLGFAQENQEIPLIGTRSYPKRGKSECLKNETRS